MTLSLCSFPQLFVAFSDAIPVCAQSKWHQRSPGAKASLAAEQNGGIFWFTSLYMMPMSVCELEFILTVSIFRLFLPLLCFDISVGPRTQNMNLSSVPWTQTESTMNCSCSEGNSDIWGQWGGRVISQGSGVPLTCVLAVQILGCPGSLSKDLHANWCYWIHLGVMCFHKFKYWRRWGSLVALSWQFDSGSIICAWVYNKQELSRLIRYAQWRSLYPNPTLNSLHSPLPRSNASLSEGRREKFYSFL